MVLKNSRSDPKPKLDHMSGTAVLILADKLRDDVGDFGEWLSAEDVQPGFRPDTEPFDAGLGRNVGYWFQSRGGTDRRFAYLKTRKVDIQRAFREVLPPLIRERWVLRANHDFGWEPLPVFPYRLLWNVLKLFNIPDPDSYIKTGSHKLARGRGTTALERINNTLSACGPKDCPWFTTTLHDAVTEMRGRGFRCTGYAYQFARDVQFTKGSPDWEGRLELRERMLDSDFVSMQFHSEDDSDF